MTDSILPPDGQHRAYAAVIRRYDALVGSRRSEVQKRLDAEGEGLILVHETLDGEDKMYVTKNPELIAKYCDRLEAERDAN